MHLRVTFHYSPHYLLQVKMVLEKLYENKKIASATHNIYAYRLVMSHIAYIVAKKMYKPFVMLGFLH